MTPVVLDTCVVLWLAGRQSTLSENARGVLADPAVALHVSAISAWEIAVKTRKGKLGLPTAPEVWWQRFLGTFGVHEVAVTGARLFPLWSGGRASGSTLSGSPGRGAGIAAHLPVLTRPSSPSPAAISLDGACSDYRYRSIGGRGSHFFKVVEPSFTMRTNYGWLVVTAMALLPACSDDSEKVVKNDGAADGPGTKDVRVADSPFVLAETQALPDAAPDLAPPEVTPDLPAVEAGQPDRILASEAGGDVSGEAGVMDLRKGVEVQDEAGKPDAALPDAAPEVAGEVGPPPSYTCRNDADCCIAIDNCMGRAYLYSKAPGASPIPPFTGLNDMCLACIPPAVQVRCESGQCVGEKLPQVYSGSLVQSHCGPVALPDAGAVLYYPAAYAGAPQTSWGCGG